MASIAQPGNACEAAAFFVRRGALLDAPFELDASAADRFNRVDRGRDAGLLIARAATEDQAVANVTPERVDCPARAGRHHVVVAVEVQHGAWALVGQRADYVDT